MTNLWLRSLVGGGGRHGAGKTPYGASRRLARPAGRKCRNGNELGRCEGVSMALAGIVPGAHYMWHRASDLRALRPLAPEGSVAMSRNGFTLIELLIVVVIIGLLATIAIPKFSNTKEKAYVGAMKSDLRNLATAEEAFFYDSTKYTSNFALMNNFNPSAGVTMTINATTSGWSAATNNAFAPGRQCALFSGTAAPLAPATVEGRITCQ